MNSANLTAFAEAARRFVAWAESEDAATSTGAALKHLALLYALALELPHPPGDELADDEVTASVPASVRARVISRAADLSVQYYGVVFDPLAMPPEEPVVGDVQDDIADIHADLWRGLELYDRGLFAEAAWEWGFHFRVHWGRHLVTAMGALHQQFSQEPSGSDV